MIFEFELNENDVILGRGQGRGRNRAGNEEFRRLVSAQTNNYAALGPRNKNWNSKSAIAIRIIDTVQKQGGRFLQKATGYQSCVYQLADKESVLEKVKMDLRNSVRKNAAVQPAAGMGDIGIGSNTPDSKQKSGDDSGEPLRSNTLTGTPNRGPKRVRFLPMRASLEDIRWGLLDEQERQCCRAINIRKYLRATPSIKKLVGGYYDFELVGDFDTPKKYGYTEPKKPRTLDAADAAAGVGETGSNTLSKSALQRKRHIRALNIRKYLRAGVTPKTRAHKAAGPKKIQKHGFLEAIEASKIALQQKRRIRALNIQKYLRATRHGKSLPNDTTAQAATGLGDTGSNNSLTLDACQGFGSIRSSS